MDDGIDKIMELSHGLTPRQMETVTKVCNVLSYSPEAFRDEVETLITGIRSGLSADQIDATVDAMVDKAYRLHRRRMN